MVFLVFLPHSSLSCLNKLKLGLYSLFNIQVLPAQAPAYCIITNGFNNGPFHNWRRVVETYSPFKITLLFVGGSSLKFCTPPAYITLKTIKHIMKCSC